MFPTRQTAAALDLFQRVDDPAPVDPAPGGGGDPNQSDPPAPVDPPENLGEYDGLPDHVKQLFDQHADDLFAKREADAAEAKAATEAEQATAALTADFDAAVEEARQALLAKKVKTTTKGDDDQLSEAEIAAFSEDEATAALQKLVGHRDGLHGLVETQYLNDLATNLVNKLPEGEARDAFVASVKATSADDALPYDQWLDKWADAYVPHSAGVRARELVAYNQGWEDALGAPEGHKTMRGGQGENLITAEGHTAREVADAIREGKLDPATELNRINRGG